MARRGTSPFARLQFAALLAAMALLCLVVGARAGEKVALVIGNGDYATFGTLPNPTNDADAIADTLRRMGYAVDKGNNARVEDFHRLLSDFARRADDADVALFYYSGRGLQFEDENYLLPVDARLSNRLALSDETISLSDVITAMGDAKEALIFIDASGSSARTSFDSPEAAASNSSGFAPRYLAPNTFIGFSGQSSESAHDGSDKNSPFAEALLEYLPEPGVLHIGTMFSRVRTQVMLVTDGQQRPEGFGVAPDLAGSDTAQSPLPISPPLLQAPSDPAESSYAPH